MNYENKKKIGKKLEKNKLTIAKADEEITIQKMEDSIKKHERIRNNSINR